MSGLFGTLNTANKGLNAQQVSLGTVGHNIANINTRGYSRQRVELKADRAFRMNGVGQIGTGVRMTSITRSVSSHINRQVREQMGTLSMYGSKSEALDQLEMVFNEPSESGLNYILGEMFTSWSELSKNPELGPSKTVVVEKSKTLVDTISHMANKIKSLRSGVVEEIEGNLGDFNQGIKQLEKLNDQIANASIKGDIPNDLLDQRDLLLEDLGSSIAFDSKFDEYGRVSIKIGDNEILGPDSAQGEISYNEESGEILFKGENISDSIRSGSIKGSLDGIDEIDKNMESLKNFTETMSKAINLIHSDEGKGIDFFEFESIDEDGGFAIRVNNEIEKDHSKVNVGKDIEDPLDGDGSRAGAIAKLQDTKLDFKSGVLEYDSENMSIKDSKDGLTIRAGYGDIVTQIGVSKRHCDDMIANQLIITEQILMKQQSVSGVNMNEEITDMIKFQQAYNANARVIQTISEMLDTLIHNTGV